MLLTVQRSVHNFVIYYIINLYSASYEANDAVVKMQMVFQILFIVISLDCKCIIIYEFISC
jgi:hypothetical protein